MSESPCLYKKKSYVKSLELDDNFSDITMTTLSLNERFDEKCFDFIDNNINNNYIEFFSCFLKKISEIIGNTYIDKLYFNLISFLDDIEKLKLIKKNICNINMKEEFSKDSQKKKLIAKYYKYYFYNSIDYYFNINSSLSNYYINKFKYEDAKYLLNKKDDEIFNYNKIVNYFNNSLHINRAANKIKKFIINIFKSKKYKNYFKNNFYFDWIVREKFLDILCKDIDKFFNLAKDKQINEEKLFNIDNYVIYVPNIKKIINKKIEICILIDNTDIKSKIIIFKGYLNLEKKVLIYGEIFYNNNLLLFKGSMNFFSDYFNYYRFINECNSSLLTHSFKIHHDIYNKNDLEFYYFKTSYDTFKFYKNNISNLSKNIFFEKLKINNIITESDLNDYELFQTNDNVNLEQTKDEIILKNFKSFNLKYEIERFDM